MGVMQNIAFVKGVDFLSMDPQMSMTKIFWEEQRALMCVSEAEVRKHITQGHTNFSKLPISLFVWTLNTTDASPITHHPWVMSIHDTLLMKPAFKSPKSNYQPIRAVGVYIQGNPWPTFNIR